MLIRSLWKNIILDAWCPSFVDYLFVLLITPFVFLLDLLSLPIEIIAFILYRIIEGKWNDD